MIISHLVTFVTSLVTRRRVGANQAQTKRTVYYCSPRPVPAAFAPQNEGLFAIAQTLNPGLEMNTPVERAVLSRLLFHPQPSVLSAAS